MFLNILYYWEIFVDVIKYCLTDSTKMSLTTLLECIVEDVY